MNNKTLETRAIPGYEGCYIMNLLGVIHSVTRTTTDKRGRNRVHQGQRCKLNAKVGANGQVYRSITLWKDGKASNYAISTLMKATFPELFLPVKDELGEVWKKIAANPKYMVSSFGRVKRTAYTCTSGIISYKEPETLCTIHYSGEGEYRYPNVSITAGEGKKKLNLQTVCRLVYEAFIGPVPEGKAIKHYDGNNRNNDVGNLYIPSLED